MVMSPQYLRSDVVYDVDSSDRNCCLLYFNANIMCSFTKKLQLPTRALSLDPAGGLRPIDPVPELHPWTPLGFQTPVFFYVPPIIL